MENNGKRVKCSCGSTLVHVDTVHECSTCKQNGFILSPDTAEALGVGEKYMYYDERLRIDAGTMLNKTISRTECEDSGECDMGTNWNAGCSLYICAECDKTVDFVAFVDGC